jgi:hypothetical protein
VLGRRLRSTGVRDHPFEEPSRRDLRRLEEWRYGQIQRLPASCQRSRRRDETRYHDAGGGLPRDRWFESGFLQRGVRCQLDTLVDGGPMVRIHLPPAGSLVRT